MAARIAVFLTALLFLFFGIAALFPSLIFLPPPRLRYYDMHMIGTWGYLFGWMPVNLLHDVIYIVLGSSGLIASPLRTAAIWYCRGVFFLALSFACLGFLPLGIDRLWGLLPLFDWNIMFHTVLAILMYYFGFIYPVDWGAPMKPDEAILVA